MPSFKLVIGLAAFASISGVQADNKDTLILCDCGIGDNKEHPTWSTSRQMNWYTEIEWPDSAKKYPNAPDKAVQVPFNDGIYPWTPKGVTATLPGNEVWTAYIEDGTPDGFKAGTAVSTRKGGETLNCWAYRGRPVSAAMNKTVTNDAVCWTAFVCNAGDAPSVPDDMSSPTSSAQSSSAPPSTTFVSQAPPTATDGGGSDDGSGSAEPTATPDSHAGELFLDADVNPRFINWENTWEAFINNFVWDKQTGKCNANPILGKGYNITVECGGIQVDKDSHMTLLMLQAMRDVGANSLWFNQNPTLPGGTSGNATAPASWVVMPEAFTLTATDVQRQKVVGYVTYKTQYDGFLPGACSTCDTKRFDKNFFDPIIAAMQGSYPMFNKFTVQGECKPWQECK